MGVNLIKGLLHQNGIHFKLIVALSAGASLMVVVILLLKKAVGNRLSPQWHYGVWLLLLIKLLLPFSISSSLSMNNLLVHIKPVHGPVLQQVESASPDNPFDINGDTDALESQPLEIIEKDQQNPISVPVETQNWPHRIKITNWEVGGGLWLIGMLSILFFYLYSYSKILRDIKTVGRPLEDWIQQEFLLLLKEKRPIQKVNLQGVQGFSQPFVIGIFHPTIILPLEAIQNLEASQLRAILRHEIEHIKWQDHGIRVLMLIAQAIHWFNPLIWFSFDRMIKDCESACDARVIKEYDEEMRREYAATLLLMAELQRSQIGSGVPAFGESNFRKRVIDVLRYKKYSIITTFVAVILIVLLGITLLTEPKEPLAATDREQKQGDKLISEETVDQALANEIENKLETILAGGDQLSSNPYAYISNSQAFEELVKLGEPALQYMVQSFKEVNEDSLREYIMAAACAKIMGIYDEKEGIAISSGREWFYKYVGVIDKGHQFHKIDADADLFPEQGEGKEVILPDGIDRGNIEEVVTNYLLARKRRSYYQGEKAIEAHKIHRIEEKEDYITLYMEVSFAWYGFENGYFTPVSGSGAIPTVMVLKESGDGYQVIDYQEAMDGGMWLESIKQMFPSDIAEMILGDDANTAEELRQLQQEKAAEYLTEINRSEAKIKERVDKYRDNKEKRRAITLVTNVQGDFPDWEGTKEILVRTGGKHPGAKVRVLLETSCTEGNDGTYEVLLQKTWDISINGIQPISYWKYKVTEDRMELVDSENNDGSVAAIE